MSIAQIRTVGERTYEVTPLASTASIRVMTRMLKMAAPAFATVASLREAAQALGMLLAAGCAGLDEEVLLFAATEFSKVTKVIDGDKKVPLTSIFDEHFRGRVGDMMEWMNAAAEVTYGPLVSSSRGGKIVKALMAAKEALSAEESEKSEKASTQPAPSTTPGG